MMPTKARTTTQRTGQSSQHNDYSVLVSSRKNRSFFYLLERGAKWKLGLQQHRSSSLAGHTTDYRYEIVSKRSDLGQVNVLNKKRDLPLAKTSWITLIPVTVSQ
jgi:hypothetical protein